MEHRAAEAARRLHEYEAKLNQARRDLAQAVQSELKRGIRMSRIAEDTGISRYTLYKYAKWDLGNNQGKAPEPLAAAA